MEPVPPLHEGQPAGVTDKITLIVQYARRTNTYITRQPAVGYGPAFIPRFEDRIHYDIRYLVYYGCPYLNPFLRLGDRILFHQLITIHINIFGCADRFNRRALPALYPCLASGKCPGLNIHGITADTDLCPSKIHSDRVDFIFSGVNSIMDYIGHDKRKSSYCPGLFARIARLDYTYI